MKVYEILTEDGRIVKGVNTTADVGVDQTRIEAAKFGNTVDRDGRPPTLSTKVKGKSTNVLFNLGLTEGIMLKFQRGEDFDTLHIKPKGKNRVELRGKPGYERGNYDAQDKLHQVLDNLGKAANFAELMNGETVTINPKHPDGERAKKTAQDILSTENVQEGSLRIPTSQLRSMIIQMLQDMETQHDTAKLVKIARMLGKEVYFMKKGDQVVLQDPDFDFYSKENIDTLTNVYEKWSQKYKRSINCNNPRGFSQKAHCAGRKKNEDIDENFADGKKKGKSRPGRVKRSGASCNGSVTSLRKRAKAASGEKARMYHWCANMKSGRKKKS